jgi:transcriptional regulator with XRE-family HTH domain
MKTRRTAAIKHCPHCGARIVPTPKEMREWRKAAHLSQREMGARLKISPAYVAYLEGGERLPSASVIQRYWKFRSELDRWIERRTGRRR